VSNCGERQLIAELGVTEQPRLALPPTVRRTPNRSWNRPDDRLSGGTRVFDSGHVIAFPGQKRNLTDQGDVPQRRLRRPLGVTAADGLGDVPVARE
jgi:hypothetical protein